MLRNVKTSLLPLCSIVTGFGLLAAGCTSTESPAPDADVNFGCVADETTFAIDHTELQAVDGVAPSTEEVRQYRGKLATQFAQSLKVKQCSGQIHVTFAADGNGYKSGELTVVDAYLVDNGIEGVIVTTAQDGSKSEATFHATATR